MSFTASAIRSVPLLWSADVKIHSAPKDLAAMAIFGSSAAIIMNDQTITEAQLAQILGAAALPTYVFLDSEGQPITKTTGFYDARTLLELLKNVAHG